ncbi:MAG: DUF2779 domain-containing protein [Planctomycetota bacterium]|jgi:hypothetical protein
MQCAKRLHLECHHPDEIPEATVGRQSLLDAGEQLLELARQGFPNGRSIESDDTDEAAEQTREILGQKEGAAVFDAAFVLDHAEVRCDIALPTGRDQLDIFEVKSGTKVKPRHIMDFAFQVYVIEACGHTVRNASILHLSPEYLHDGSKDLPPHVLFKNVDVSKKVRKRIPAARAYVDNYLTVLSDETTLELPMGTWCTAPIPCHYVEECRVDASAHPLLELPDITKVLESELHQEGIEDLQQLDEKRDGLTLIQRRALRSVTTNQLVVEPAARKSLDEAEYPVGIVHVDFALHVIPQLKNSRPWEHVPFQWNAHVVQEDGAVEQHDWLADGKDDPRPGFIRSLAECADQCGTLALYTNRLDSVLKQLLEELRDEKPRLRALLHVPMLSLDHMVRTGIYHPDLRGSFALEVVLRALAPELELDSLPIRTPEEAAAAFQRMLASRTRATTRQKLSSQLEEYGGRRSQGLWRVCQLARGA